MDGDGQLGMERSSESVNKNPTNRIESSNEEDEIQDGLAARRHALDDARRTLDDHLDSVKSLGKKGWRVMQFNGVVATITVTLLPAQVSLSKAHPIQFVIFALALFGMLISTWFGYRMQTPQNVVSGPGTDVYKLTSEFDYPEDEYLRDILLKYSEAITDVQKETETASGHLQLAVSMSALSMAFLFMGIITAFVL